MRKIILCFPVAVLLYSCSGTKEQNNGGSDANASFNAFKQRFVLALWKQYPGWASGTGFHAYDSILTIPDDAFRKQELNFNAAYLDCLGKFKPDDLNDYNKTDLQMMTDYLHASDWGIEKLQAFKWDPSQYNVCGAFAEMLNNDYGPLEERLRDFHLKMKNVPAFYEAAKKNIASPTLEHAALAIAQNEGGLAVFEEDLQAALEKSKLGETEKKVITESAKVSATAVKGFAAWLKEMKNENPRSFRLGKELYTEKFKHDLQSGFSADEIYKEALKHKKELHVKMYALTKELWPTYMKGKHLPPDTLKAIGEMINLLSAKHVKPDSFQTAIEKQIPDLVKFVNEKNLIYLDPTKPLVVRKEPAYMAGLAGASISSPGPYDKNGNTYYNVGSMNGWTKERSESYLREYNHYILQILNIHEAIPGHYAQLIYSNKSAGEADSGHAGQMPGIIKSILGNGAMVEGWAVYTEKMMLQNGYGAGTGANTADPEMWLMYYKWNLRSTCNTILDHSIHALNMEKEEALKLLTGEAFQQQAEAEGKWKRATLSQVQLCSYFTGFTEICKLREEMKQKLGDKFDLKSFHEKFLSYGSAPVKYIRELMLSELDGVKPSTPVKS
jgi:uncharacterized protein (DUF885 family)